MAAGIQAASAALKGELLFFALEPAVETPTQYTLDASSDQVDSRMPYKVVHTLSEEKWQLIFKGAGVFATLF